MPRKPPIIPSIIPILPTIKASNKTVFLICLPVVPIDEYNPKLFFLSIVDIAKELYITTIHPTDITDKAINIKGKKVLFILSYFVAP